MRKFYIAAIFIILSAIPCFAQGGLTDFPLRQRVTPYISAGQYWHTTEFTNIRNTSPTWWFGGGLDLRISEDNKWSANTELKLGAFNTRTHLGWSIKYRF